MQTPRGRRIAAVLLASALLVAGCSGSGSDSGSPATTSTADRPATSTPTEPSSEDRFPGKDWDVEDPADHGIDVAALEKASSYAFQEEAHTQGLVVVHRGAIVYERYAPGSDKDSPAASWSMAKSITSAVVGIAIEEGKIPGVDAPMTTWYPKWADEGLGTVKLRDVLQMATGQRWNENYDPTQGPSDIINMVATEKDQLAYAESRPPAVPPGTEFNYSSGVSMLMSGILQQATGMRADEYAQQKLIEPIGMSKVKWWRDAAGHTLTYCCFDTTSRDFARIGLLYLHGGKWGDRQVVPAQWVRDSLTPSPTSDGAYGYQWWLNDIDGVPDDAFFAQGFDGQWIYVVPSLDLIVVRNGTYVQNPGPPVADPNLFSVYPPSGFVEGKGTRPPEGDWDSTQMLRLVVDAVRG
ncbi:MAG: serine hydrolase [Acidimicrobiales bacterium]|nr:serine hydrolase [Acidimicrobiales bacterium]